MAINDLTDTKTLAHLFKHDSLHGAFEGEVSYDSELTMVIGTNVKIFGWYDIEFGYSNRIADLIELISKQL